VARAKKEDGDDTLSATTRGRGMEMVVVKEIEYEKRREILGGSTMLVTSF
jgi:hypothetical protein